MPGSPEAIARAEAIIDGLAGMPAMEGISDQLRTMMNRQKLSADLARKGKKQRRDFKHMILEGPPGTGKSTMLESIGEVLSLIGATASSTTVEITPTDIEGKYIGDATNNLNAHLKNANGGVLMIDEAHQFANNEFTENALRALVDTLADPNRKEVVIIAGYPDKIHEAMASIDPGLESRFKYRMSVERYDSDQLIEAAQWQMKESSLSNADKKAALAMEVAIETIEENPDHASARDVDAMVAFALDHLATRWSANPEKVANDRLTAEDWKHAVLTYRSRNKPVEKKRPVLVKRSRAKT